MDLVAIMQTKINGAEVNSVNLRDLHEKLESKQDFQSWFKKQSEALEHYEEGVDYIRMTKDKNHSWVEVKKSLNLQGKQAEYIVSLDMAKHLAMLSKTQKGREVRKYFIEAEKKLTSQLPQNFSEALRMLANEVEQKDLALKQRDEAIRTKAYIGNSREAKAMATASVAVREANKLKIELDKSKEYCTIKRMSLLTHGLKFSYKILRDVSATLNIRPIDVYDANYGSVKAYHKKVWKEAYQLSLNDLEKEVA